MDPQSDTQQYTDVIALMKDFGLLLVVAALILLVVYWDKIQIFIKKWKADYHFLEKTKDEGNIASNIPFEEDNDQERTP